MKLSQLFRLFRRKKSDQLIGSSADQQLVRRVQARRFLCWKQLRQVGRLLTSKELFVLRVALVIFVLSLLWTGAALGKSLLTEVPREGGVYEEAIVGSPQFINPLFASVNEADTDLARLIFSGIMRYDEQEGLAYDLAKYIEKSADGLTYTVSLRDDAYWHDGQKLTAKDVVFTIETIQLPNVNSPLRLAFDRVGVEAVDEFTVKFTLPEKFAPFLSMLTVGIMPEHIWGLVSPERMHLAAENLKPIGSGPYQQVSYAKEDTGFIYRYVLRRFDRYYGKRPYIDEVRIRFFSDYDSAVTALREEKVDGLHFLPHEFRDRAERKYIDFHTLELPQYTALFLNQEANSFLADASARKALSFAIDRQRLVSESLESNGQPIAGPILPGFPGYTEEIGLPAVNIDEANKLLDVAWPRLTAEAYRAERKKVLLEEWNKAHEGAATSTLDAVTAEAEVEALLQAEIRPAQLFYRKKKDGTMARVKIVTADREDYQRAAELIAAAWQEIGVETIITFLAPKDIEREALKGRKYDALLYAVIIGIDPDQYPFWHSTQAVYPGLNLSSFKNRKADELLEKAREAGSHEEMGAAYQELGAIIDKEQPAIFLYMPTYTYATNAKVHGISIKKISTPADRFSDLPNWFVKTSWRLK